MAERTTDTLGNIALIQSFARIEIEVSQMRKVGDMLLGAQMPVLSWWALAAVLTRASTTLTMLAILIVGIFLYIAGQTTVGEIVMFMSFATMLIGKLEQVVHFANQMVMDAPRLQEFFDVLDTVPAVRDRPDAIDPGRMRGLVEFEDVSYSYDGKRPAVEDLNFTALPGETIALVGATGAGKSTALALLHRVFDPQSGAVKIDGMDIRGLTLSGLRHNIGVVFQEALLFNRSIAENLRVGKPDATDEEMREACQRAQVLEIIERNPEGFAGQRRRTRPAAVGRRAPAPLDRARAAQGPADPDPRRGDERARRADRSQGAGGAGRGHEGPHHLRDRAPARHHPQCDPHPGVPGRAHHRDRHLRRTGGPGRPIRRARPHAIHDSGSGEAAD